MWRKTATPAWPGGRGRPAIIEGMMRSSSERAFSVMSLCRAHGPLGNSHKSSAKLRRHLCRNRPAPTVNCERDGLRAIHEVADRDALVRLMGLSRIAGAEIDGRRLPEPGRQADVAVGAEAGETRIEPGLRDRALKGARRKDGRPGPPRNPRRGSTRSGPGACGGRDRPGRPAARCASTSRFTWPPRPNSSFSCGRYWTSMTISPRPAVEDGMLARFDLRDDDLVRKIHQRDDS